MKSYKVFKSLQPCATSSTARPNPTTLGVANLYRVRPTINRSNLDGRSSGVAMPLLKCLITPGKYHGSQGRCGALKRLILASIGPDE